ncbi:hypothetical protein BDZ97DRAFT_919962 [Flammula alnicola]|nr:hypothetical protein BDZ97DRAFT_919962 [Flammula alnicola]
MSARLARSAFRSATRRAQTNASTASSKVSRRTMSSTSHGAEAKSSDTPWIVGSALLFGPAFLYLVSPSGRKSIPHVHDDKHDFPTLKTKEEHAPAPTKTEPPVEILKDDEGTEADVGSSIAVAEGNDVPNASQPPEDQAANLASAELAEVGSTVETSVENPEAAQSESKSAQKEVAPK